MPKNLNIIMLVICLLALTSCAGIQRVEQSPEDALSHRAELYWKAFTSRDWDQVEKLIDPDIREKTAPYIQSLRQSQPMSEYLSFREIGLEINGDKAVVTYELEKSYLHPMLQQLPPQQVEFADDWVRRNNQWYIIEKQHSIQDLFESLTNMNKGGNGRE